MGRSQECYHHLEGLKSLADSATSSRHILTLTNAPADESSNASINDATSSSPMDDTTNPLVDDTGQHAEDTIDDNDGFLFPGADDIFSADHRDFQLHRLTYKKVILSSLPNHLETRLDYIPKTSQLDPDTLGYIERILDFHSDVDGILEYIMVTRAVLISGHKRNTQQYTNLAIIEQMVNNLCLWSEKRDESEATFYRRLASILDTLLVDSGVILADGETSLQSSKVAIAMNTAIFHTSDMSQAYGRKIDMILKCSSNVKVDISSNEWKRAMISKSIKLHQQSKNLRLNTSNLFSLNTKFGVKFTVVMDFVGNSGYLYLL
ncbi:hypothetical protein BDB00DRAFT_928890 [Zychaea mexicana]|uniref:uncharacterized protein n=1 Tax=Zychaea mexicana TaxID=64656 RepID=UPI0022FF44A8|nr:uncharacterized protein BDB00DRAFT_928890 [Zychaea mexicana]KAI9493570.1 hypothetical protein BDB00DRAFT_928890 [Zychaea mexicana]